MVILPAYYLLENESHFYGHSLSGIKTSNSQEEHLNTPS
jgi:hypothetical protein